MIGEVCRNDIKNSLAEIMVKIFFSFFLGGGARNKIWRDFGRGMIPSPPPRPRVSCLSWNPGWPWLISPRLTSVLWQSFCLSLLEWRNYTWCLSEDFCFIEHFDCWIKQRDRPDVVLMLVIVVLGMQEKPVVWGWDLVWKRQNGASGMEVEKGDWLEDPFILGQGYSWQWWGRGKEV